MTRSASPACIAAATLLGVATGMRSFLPLAVLSVTRSNRRGLRALLVPLAASELVADKLPRMGSRLAPGPLTARVVAAGIGTCWLVPSRNPAPLVLAGAAGALAGAFLGHRARTRLPAATGTPDLPWAALEDATAATLVGTALHLTPG
jgi:uncharacterized membrane protein